MIRKIDQQITQAADAESLLYHLQLTLHAAHTEAKLSFQRQLEHYEILENRIKQIRESFPKRVIDAAPQLPGKSMLSAPSPIRTRRGRKHNKKPASLNE